MTTSSLKPYRPTLAVYAVWHPASEQGRAMAEALRRRLSRDLTQPLDRAIDIPVFFRSVAAEPGTTLPRPIDLEAACHSVVVVMGDMSLVLAREEGWGGYLADLLKRCQADRSPHRFLLLQLDETAVNAVEGMKEQSVSVPEGALREETLVNRVSYELCRLLLAEEQRGVAAAGPPGSVRLFISYARADGRDRAVELREHIDASAYEKFFDETTLVPAYEFPEQLEKSLRNPRAALLVLQTDAYSTRPWCRREVLTAKRCGRPVVVVHAIRQGEERSFPYLGNVRTLRVDGSDQPWDDLIFERIIGLALRESLREIYLRRHFEDMLALQAVPWQAITFPRPPELLTVLFEKAEGRMPDDSTGPPRICLYPDPPLGEEELEVLDLVAPNTLWLTPTMLPLYWSQK